MHGVKSWITGMNSLSSKVGREVNCRHHPTDVIARIILGGGIAYAVYRLRSRPLALEWYNFSTHV